MNNGIFFTLKELATRPGHSIKEYLLGKRASHMNYMSLFVLLSGLGILLDGYSKVSLATIISTNKEEQSLISNYFNFVRDNPKTFIFITIPIIAFFTFQFYKKSKFNYSEHLILNIYKASALLIISKLIVLFSIITSNISFLKVINQIVDYGIIAYSFWFLYQFFYDENLYSKAGIITRTILSVVLGMLFSSIFMFIYWFITVMILKL
ncbi:DUF3667 domain-containing protein [Flavobacterium sp. LMO8]|uniref:DUF3667 domain-containing protein n=1 Tax=Flavobacterium sp. LMO8 TaxID=2654244 RepID=UPI0013969A3A|nr:DUF3667 domain-containing protein [Flavobacterium sp. LMO8]